MKRLYTILFLFAYLPCISFAQSLDQAKKLYNEGNYEEAKPAFERLVKQSPNNSSYNLWYGVCCYETGDIENAEKHLLVANKRKVADSYNYLAHIYTQMYQFDKALEMWDDFIALKTKKKEDTEPFEKDRSLVEKMQRLLNNTEDVQVIDSVVVDKDRILSSYFLSEDCGSLDSYNHFFGSNEHIPTTVYINPKGDQAYYARQSGFDQFKLFTQSKLLDTWSDESTLFEDEEENDNNYPFVLGDGITLYFASKGNGSIGGYDLFITRYNTNTNSYLAPEQLGMPFNSPANDYLMVIDETKGTGWFVSDRYQPEGKVCIYLFIPDESRKRIEEVEDEEWMRRRAALKSIQETWKDGSDYSELIRLARTNLSENQQIIEKDFEFVINDRITYNTWEEFQSAEARSFYEKVTGLDKQIETLEKKLEEARAIFAGGNASSDSQLKSSILNGEEQLRKLRDDKNNWIKKARNAENVHLSN